MKALVVDQSNNNNAIDFNDAKRHGVKGYIHKITEGDHFVDKYAAMRIRRAKNVGMKTGLYHFARPDKNPGTAGAIREARFYAANFVRVNGGKPGRRSFKPILDFETKGGNVAWVKAFNKEAKRLLGSYPIFYSYYYMAKDLKAVQPLGSGLWLAGHPVGQPIQPPTPWKRIYLYQTVAKGLGNFHEDIDVNTTQTIFGLRPLLAKPLLG
jgi:lysozyme